MAQTEVITSDGKKITIADFPRPSIRDFWFYNGKIWKPISTSGIGKEFRVVLERPLANEKVVLKGRTDEYKSAKIIIKPTGHISV